MLLFKNRHLTVVAALDVKGQEFDSDESSRRLRDEVGALPVARVRVRVIRGGDDARGRGELSSTN